MTRSFVRPESADERARNISAFCKEKGPHLSFGGKITVGPLAKDMAADYPHTADGSVPDVEQK